MLNYSANGPSGYNLTNSLRFRANASAYLNRTPASAGNRKTWTWSAWIKRGELPTRHDFFSAGTATNNTDTMAIRFDSSANLTLAMWSADIFQTSQLFRDPSAWYHIVLAMDTTQATASNRTKLYINGTQVTNFTSITYPSQNADLGINGNVAHNIGRLAFSGGAFYFDGYMTEVNFIDGQALTPSSFGNTNAVTGVWQPAKYTGTYGTNGFYLNFTDIALTSGSNTGLGRDFSGNGNFWNTNNISVTSGTTYDAMRDVPTNTSATVANYCVWNPLAGSINTISNGNLTYSGSTGGDYQRNGTLAVSSGKWYFESTLSAFTGGSADMYIGFSELNGILNNSKSVGAQANQYSLYSFAGSTFCSKVTNGSFTTTTLAKLAVGDVIMLAIDLDNRQIWFGKNGSWIDSGNPATGTTPTFSSITAGSYVPGVTLSGGGVLVTVDSTFGQRPFTYTPPTGFNAWNTFNLPTSTIVKGNTVMDATLYTGNGSGTQTITNAAGFRPDLVWAKCRNTASQNNVLVDSVRGASIVLSSNLTDAEQALSSINPFNSNGFGANGLVANGYAQNVSGYTYVGWQWQAGQGTNTTNTAGSITSTVSVNATAGFSVVTYTSQASGTATFGHGLGVAPSMIFLKGRNVAGGWYVYHSALGGTKYLALQSTGAATTASDGWNNTNPTSTVVSVGNGYAGSYNMVAYCWAEIAGFSKFGSYTGNASTDGPFIYLGFRPKFVMAKMSSGISNWYIRDTSRDTSNTAFRVLYPDTTDVEGSDTTFGFDLLSNGFKVRSSANGANQSGQTFIYAAFAENPFKNALAR